MSNENDKKSSLEHWAIIIRGIADIIKEIRSSSQSLATIAIAIGFSVTLSTVTILYVPQVQEAIIGPQGEPGLRGEQGIPGESITGPQGLQGIQGLQGDTGNVGPEGPIGLTGEQGIQGLQGLSGIPGEQGIQGLQGDTGNVGPEGPIGLTGEQGIQGLQGLSGIPGEQGIQGVKGDTGDIGPPGPGFGELIFDSGWIAIDQGEGRVIYKLPSDLNVFVYMIGRGRNHSIHQIYYGGDVLYDRMEIYSYRGASWSVFNDNFLMVSRYRDDFDWEEVRVIVWQLTS